MDAEDNNNVKSDDFTQSKIFVAIAQLKPDSSRQIAELITSGEDVHMRGTYDETFLHVLAAPRPDNMIPHVEAIAFVLSEAGIDVNARDREGNTVLHVCAMNEASPCLAATLIRIGVDPGAKNSDGQTAMDLCCSDNFKRQLSFLDPGMWTAVQKGRNVEHLIDSWCKIDIKMDGKRLIETADDLNDSYIVGCLKRGQKRSELVHCALSGRIDRLSGLVEEDSSMCRTKCKGFYLDGGEQVEWPLVAETIRLGVFDSARVLLQHTDVSEILDLGGDNKVPICLWALDYVTYADDEFKVELFRKGNFSSVDNQLDFMYQLWRKGFPWDVLQVLVVQHLWNPVQRDSNGYSLRDLIFMETLHLPREEMLAHVGFVDQVFLYLAAIGDKERLEKLAITGYEYVNVCDLDGRTSESEAEANDHKPTAEFLKRLPELQVRASRLHLMIRAANLQEAKELMAGNMVRARDRAGRTALHKALLFEKLYVTKHIVQHFKEVVDLQDANGKTALHYASCMKDRSDLTTILLDGGADKSIKDNDGITAEDFREKYDRDFIELERTKEYGGDIYLLERYLTMANAIQLGDTKQLNDLVETLLQYDLNDFKTHLEQMDRIQYRSLVFLCIDHGQSEMAKQLMTKGADPTEPGLVFSEEDSQLVLPIDYANMMEDYDLVEFIQQLQSGDSPVTAQESIEDDSKPSTVDQAAAAPKDDLSNDGEESSAVKSPPKNKATSSACNIL